MQNIGPETSVLSGSSRMSSSRPTKPEIDNNRYNKEDQKIDQNMVLVQRDAKMEQRKLFPKPVEQAALASKVFNQLQTELELTDSTETNISHFFHLLPNCNSISECGIPEKLSGVENLRSVKKGTPKLTGWTSEKLIELCAQYKFYKHNGGESNLAKLIAKDYHIRTSPMPFSKFTDDEVIQMLNTHFEDY